MAKDRFQILVAEDDVSHAAAIRRSLEKGYPTADISIVKSIREFQSAVAESVPAIALIDLHLSDGQSLGLLTSVDDALFPVIMMTSFGSQQLAVDSIKSGALDYIIKSPDTFKSIVGVVDGAMREWNLLQEKKLMESQLKESQARIIQQEKMASIGQLAAGVAHEINNPIGYISSNMTSLGRYAEKLTQYIKALEQSVETFADQSVKLELADFKKKIKLDYILKDLDNLITESLEGAQRVSKIVQDLKSFSREEKKEAVLSDLNENIRSTLNIVRNEIKYVAELDLQLGEVPPLLCHPQQISQVVMNLLVNAAHAIGEKGVITLKTGINGDYVEIDVTDTGCGIPPQVIKKIFDPFFTTKDPGKGTGLGLSISLDIIRKHGGELLVNSEPGVGTTFTVRLPVAGHFDETVHSDIDSAEGACSHV
jgi:signal transduction histidine kinase